MKIIITGTRGVPALYGGFETFAGELSRRLAAGGHMVTVCNPSFHPYRHSSWEGVTLVRKPWPSLPGGVLWYDRLCMREAYRRRPDVILNCGYGNALFIRKEHPVPVVTLTDGLEWRRTGWSPAARMWLRKMEKTAVSRSRLLISDHPVIARHYRDRYQTETPVIPYGAALPRDLAPPAAGTLLPSRLRRKILPGKYFLTVGRFVPENNLEMILKGYLRSGIPYPLLVVGNTNNRFGRSVLRKYGHDERIFFPGTIFDKVLLDRLRHHARGYLHGHSAGGTNPALLEAMAAGSLIAAHDNPFNRYVLGSKNAFFSSVNDLGSLLSEWDAYMNKKESLINAYLHRIRTEYSWEEITSHYLAVFETLLKEGKGNP